MDKYILHGFLNDVAKFYLLIANNRWLQVVKHTDGQTTFRFGGVIGSSVPHTIDNWISLNGCSKVCYLIFFNPECQSGN